MGDDDRPRVYTVICARFSYAGDKLFMAFGDGYGGVQLSHDESR